ncbi:hypothetical protein HDV00_003963 [Rhizophlyctis rosea]|nr:hypothetical protein HDV00_003963 [Rhizophlyctis rosea]
MSATLSLLLPSLVKAGPASCQRPLLSNAVRRGFPISKRQYAKQADASSQQDDEGSPLPPFFPKPADSKLPEIPLTRRQLLHLPPEFREGRELMKAIKQDQLERHDFDGRRPLFLNNRSPDFVQPGSIVLVEQLASRSRPRKQVFAGVVLGYKNTGIMRKIVLRNYVLGTGVEMEFPVFSPMVRRIKVLKRVSGMVGPGAEDIYWLRDRPEASPLAFDQIDQMVVRDREAEKRLAAAAAAEKQR